MSFGPLAYVDPGAGSMLLQIILGGVAGLVVAARLVWGRVRDRLGFGKAARRSESASKGEGNRSS